MSFEKPSVKYESLPEVNSDTEGLLHAGLLKPQRDKQQETIRLLTYANVFLAALLLSLSVTCWATTMSNRPDSYVLQAHHAHPALTVFKHRRIRLSNLSTNDLIDAPYFAP